jgi:hypothetical protein
VDQEENTIMDPSQTDTGINDVHSSSTGMGTDGTAYNTW